MTLTPPIGRFGWCQLAFHIILQLTGVFTALTHNVDSRVLLNTPPTLSTMCKLSLTLSVTKP